MCNASEFLCGSTRNFPELFQAPHVPGGDCFHSQLQSHPWRRILFGRWMSSNHPWWKRAQDSFRLLTLHLWTWIGLVTVFLGPVLTKPLAPIVIQRGKCWLPHLVLHSSGPIKKIHSHDCGKCIYFPAHQVAVLSFPLLWSPAKNHSSRSGANPVPSKLEAKQHMLIFICINRKMWDSNFPAFKM